MSFWIVTTALSVLVAALIGLALLRGRAGAEPAAAYDLRVYRDQLREIDKDLARGVLNAADADRLRTEVSRRILAADAQLQKDVAGTRSMPRGTAVMAALVALVLVGGGFALYRQLGAPGYGDLSLDRRIALAAEARADRPGQAEVEAQMPPRPTPQLSAEFSELLTRLREILKDRPDDLQGHILLARNEAASGNYAAAHAAQARVIAIKGDAATAQDYADLADMMILATGGYVSPQAEAALQAALTRDPANGGARYYWGLMMAQTGRPDQAFLIWDRLLTQSDPRAPWVAPIRAQIEEMSIRAGQRYTLPPENSAPLRGPSREDIDAAGDLSAADRLEMIQSMVASLSDRLANEGGTPEEWARLITSLGVLGRSAEARAIHANALEVFADAPGALDMVNRAAEQAGVAQ